MIRTITEAECLALTVPGDVPGVLDGYVGPVIWGGRTERIALGREHEGHVLVVDDGTGDMTHWAPSVELRLPLANPLVQAHLVGWLGRGLACNCRGGYRDPRHSDGICCVCSGTGYLRPPHNRYPWLTPTDHGGIPDWIRLALIWGSVVRVAAGMGALTEALGPWAPDVGSLARDTWGRPLIGSCLVLRSAGYATSDADRRWLADGKALLDDAPAGRVIRFGVPDAP